MVVQSLSVFEGAFQLDYLDFLGYLPFLFVFQCSSTLRSRDENHARCV